MKNNIIVLFLLLSSSIFSQNRIILDSLTTVLEQVFDEDQKLRYSLDSVQRRYGNSSAEVNLFWRHINKQDSLNRKIVISIIDAYGWLSESETSLKANTSLFLVIQHADVETQIKYLPVLKKAIKEGNAQKEHYAYLVDRVNMKKGKYQIYGTQIGGDYKGNLCIWPIEDELNVNKRRKLLGLNSIEEYAKNSDVPYTPPAIDSLKGNVIINGYIKDSNQLALDSVEVYTTAGKFLAQTDRNGVFRIIVKKSILSSRLIFKKDRFKNGAFDFKKSNEDVLFIDFTLLE